jgi:uncharacterized protein
MAARVVHFEIPTKDVEAAKKFYANVFGWEFSGVPMGNGDLYWMIMTGKQGTPGIDGGFYQPDDKLTGGTINTVDVDNIDSAVARVEANGGSVVYPKVHLEGVGWLAYLKDPSGVLFGMMQADPNSRM